MNVVKEKESRCRPNYPTACCELLHISSAAFAACAFQILLIILVAVTYYYLEINSYFHNVIYFRTVVSLIGSIYFIGILGALIGIATGHSYLIQCHVNIIMSLMFLTDVVAVSVVLIMAIGDRNKFVESVPHYFVSAEKFYAKLGPFWMYLGAIILHITVAFNMCFLQVFNSYLSYSKGDTSKVQPVEKEANNNM